MNKSTKNYFDVCIKILECRGLSTQIKDISTQVCVQVGDTKRHSKVVRRTSKPFFDDYFVFTQFMTASEFMETLIIISALHVKKNFRIRKLIGCITMDIATVWNQPDRQLRKWFALALPSDRSVQRKAFVECDLKIVAPSEYYELLQLSSFESSEIIGSKRARYKILVYHSTGLQVQTSTFKDQEVSVRVWYAGKRESTTKKKLRESVEWNEQIAFLELFPPMRQRLTVELCVGKKVLAFRSFNIIDFFKIFNGGFLNMFGPTYIHLYAENDIYRGSLLISLESETLGQLREFEQADGITLTLIEPISQIKYGINKTFLCFGIIFELVITKANCGKDDIYLSLDMGSTTNVESKRYSATSSDKFLCVPFDKKKPCLSLTCEWPDCTHRLYNSNVLAVLTRDLQEKLDISKKMAAKGCDKEARNSLLSACHSFKKVYKKVLRLLSKGITELDAKRTMFLRNQVNLWATLLLRDINLGNVTEMCKYFFSTHNKYSEEMQDSLPLLVITLRQSKQNIGTCVIHPKDIIFSDVKEKRGKNSGKINHLFFKDKNGELVARMDVWLWLGKREQTNKCKEQFPPGYEPSSIAEVKTGQLSLPSSLTYRSSYTYTAICHVHSGYIDERAVSEGDCDSFVKVSFFDKCRQTITAKRTLSPTWKETLIILNIKLYLSPSYLMENPPPLTLQLWNESTDPPTMIGFGLVTSNVRLQPATNVTEFPLKWWSIGHNCEVLVACEIFPVASEGNSEELFSKHRHCNIIPRHLEPPTLSYRLEVIFWGMRPSYARALKHLVQPQVSIQFSTASLCSGVIARANSTFNFTRDTRIISLNLPQNRLLSPPLLFKIMSNFKYFMSISEKNIYRFEYKLPKKSQWDALNPRRTNDRTNLTSGSTHQVTFPDLIPLAEVTNDRASAMGAILQIPTRLKSIMSDFSIFSKYFSSSNENESSSDSDEELEQDWWDRYWNNQMDIYNNTLEDQEEFSGLTDVLSTFPLLKKKDNEGRSTDIGKLKAIIRLYEWPVKEPVVTMQGQDPGMGILKLSQLYSRVNLLVRVYCVKATDLYPSDLNGKSDPYIEIATQTKTVSDKLNKILCELNPVFGNYHEIIATLPIDSLLAVRVMDWDAFSKDDVIGETIIDIENRFYSKHRATCGLPETYVTAGPSAWRDIETPKEILERLCNAHNLPLPQYHEKSVTIGSKVFWIYKNSLDKEENQQRLALAVLNNWAEMPVVGQPLVGEHVETRLLFSEDRPGLVRGKLTMWVDMFDMSLGSIPLPLDIAPRSPQAFELRVNILNTAKIPLVEQLSSGDKRCTDILVAGWLGEPKNMQKTDVHCKSYSGMGNFNWRFVFPFLYYRKEKKMVFYKKNLFDIGKTEEKVPPVLHLEVYDSEGLLEDSYIGGMMLELCQMPKGAHSYRACKPEKVFDPSNYVDLFKVESLKGWWPFLINKTVLKDRGFLEAEFFLITAEEARKCPVGLGRAPPDPLPTPARAQGRKTPWQCFEEMISKQNCQSYFGLSLNFLIVLSLIVLIGLLIYTLPSTISKLRPWLEETF